MNTFVKSFTRSFVIQFAIAFAAGLAVGTWIWWFKTVPATIDVEIPLRGFIRVTTGITLGCTVAMLQLLLCEFSAWLFGANDIREQIGDIAECWAAFTVFPAMPTVLWWAWYLA